MRFTDPPDSYQPPPFSMSYGRRILVAPARIARSDLAPGAGLAAQACGSSHEPAAIDVYGFAGDIARARPAQHAHQGRNFLGFAAAPDGGQRTAVGRALG